MAHLFPSRLSNDVEAASMKEPADEILIADVLRGNREAFNELMHRHQQAVYRVAYGFTGSHQSALDLAQIIFLKAYSHLGSFASRSSFRTRLLRIAYNESVTWQKRWKREAPGSLPVSSADALVDRAADPEASVISKQERLRLIALIGRLTVRHRLTITLRYFEGCSIDEIAAVLGSSSAVTKNVLHRAHRKLRTLWRQRSVPTERLEKDVHVRM